MSTRRLASGCVLVLALLVDGGAHAQSTVEVRGDATCPSPDMVRAALHGMGLDAAWLPESVIVDVSPERLWLTLGDDPSARREIPAAADCHARAEAIALVIRTWSGDLPSHPTSAPVLTMAPAKPAPAPVELSRHVLELDGSVFFSALWGRAPGLWLALGRTPRDGGLGFRVFGATQSAQDVTLAEGRNHVQRALAGAAPTFHLRRDNLFASADLGLVATFTRARGDGYASNQGAHAWNLGALGDLRLGTQSGRFRLWLNARLLRVFHQETITIASDSGGDADTSRLNAWDLQLGIGTGGRF